MKLVALFYASGLLSGVLFADAKSDLVKAKQLAADLQAQVDQLKRDKAASDAARARADSLLTNALQGKDSASQSASQAYSDLGATRAASQALAVQVEQLKRDKAAADAARAKADAAVAAAAKSAGDAKTALAKVVTTLDAKGQATNGTVASTVKQAGDVADSNAANADTRAATQTDVTRDNGAAALKAANEAKSGNTALIVSQLGIFLALVAGYVYKAYERRQDQKDAIHKDEVAETIRSEEKAAILEARDHTDRMAREAKEAVSRAEATAREAAAALRQVHSLVNSTLTEAKHGQLQFAQANLALLNTAMEEQKGKGIEPSRETVATIDMTQRKIVELTAQIEERQKQSENAQNQLDLDMQNSAEAAAAKIKANSSV